MDISVVIVNYKSGPDTLRCVRSILDSGLEVSDGRQLGIEVVVVDNASGESIGADLRSGFPEVRFVQLSKNLGLGHGNNVGIEESSGKYVVVMNPDTLARRDTFQVLWKYMEAHPEVGVVGPRQLNPDLSVQGSCFRWHSVMTPVYRRTPLGRIRLARCDLARFKMCDADFGRLQEVDWLLGSFLFMRRSALREAGGFDEGFFLYFEDTDLCRRFHQHGWKVMYNPSAEILHNHNRESARRPWYAFYLSKATRIHLSSWFRYLRKWGIGYPGKG